MSKRTITVLLVCCFLLSGAALIVSILNARQLKRTGFVDTVRLFNEYKLKLEMEANEEGHLAAIRSTGDSMRAVYDMLLKQPGADRQLVAGAQTRIMELATAFDEEYARSNKEINEKVWSRLNPDIDAFAKKEGLDLLMGANGMGSVLYGNESRDYTTELIGFVNKRYLNGN